jgi:hypothetical protein
MDKRIKKPPVKPEKRLEWLHRVDKEGETLTHIAESDDFDIRTVRKHVELARLERDVQQARSAVLRDALESHYRDLIETARNIESQVFGEAQVSLEKEQPLMTGLRQHMPRSPLWGNLKKWNQGLIELAALQDTIRRKLVASIKDDGRLNAIISHCANEVAPASVEVLLFQMQEWSQGREGLKIDRDIHLEPASDGRVSMRYGFSHSCDMEKIQAGITTKVLADFEQKITQWPEYTELQKLYGKLERLKKGISEVLTVVLLRRIVPGKCKYCPL